MGAQQLSRLASPQARMTFGDGLVMDYFAGGGGASEGIEWAIGRPVDIAVNHNAVALSMHKANHPTTKHFSSDVWEIDPRIATHGQPVDVAWFSPDCKHFSRAKGAKPVDKKIRGLAWVEVKVAATVRPLLMFTENVPEFLDWGPLMQKTDKHGKPVFKDGEPVLVPDPARKGETFKAWVKELEALGYQVEWRMIKASDVGAPTIRERLFVVARCDGNPIRWPAPTHGSEAHLAPFRTSAECIDWSIPSYSIFLTKDEGRVFNVRRPLAFNTLRRVARGVQKFVIDNNKPYLLDARYVAVEETGLASVCMLRQFGQSVGHGADEPMGTITAGGGGKTQLMTAFLAKHYTGVTGQTLDKPLGTVTAVDHHSLVASHLIKLRGTCQHGQAVDKPMPTITAGGLHVGEVRTILTKCGLEDGDLSSLSEEQRYMAWWIARFMEEYNESPEPLLPTPRPAAISVLGHAVIDICLRMLAPKELFKAQGFGENYIHDRDHEGNKITATNQVKMCGNSVSPYVAKALVEANYCASTRKMAAACA